MSAEAERLAEKWIAEISGNSPGNAIKSLARLLDSYAEAVVSNTNRAEWRATFNAALTGMLSNGPPSNRELIDAICRSEEAANLAIKCEPPPHV